MNRIKLIEAPNTLYSFEEVIKPKLFVAGGITGTYNWQDVFLRTLDNYLIRGKTLIAYNPRREDFDMLDKTMEEEQICWEYQHLAKADIISFWFTPETLCPITLYELGYALGKGRNVVIGIDPKYKRRDDVIIQANLAGYKGSFVNSLDLLAKEVVHKIHKI